MTEFIRVLGGVLILPLPIALLLLVGGLVPLWWGRRERLGKWLVTAGTVLLLLASTAQLPRAALGSLENDYRPYLPDAEVAAAAPAAPSWIVVLCGGGGNAAGHTDLTGLSSHTLARVAEGVRLSRVHPEARLLFTGGAIAGARPCSDVMRGAAEELGVDPARIVTDTESRTTEQEAVAVERIVGDDSLVLVTAASHMPRAMALMEARGLEPVAAPAAPWVRGGRPGLLGSLRPDPEILLMSHLWTHEVLGRIWSTLRGRI